MSATNPALKAIDFFVGEWSIELSNADFLPSTDQIASFNVTYRWIEDGSAIAVAQNSSSQSASWIIGRDETDDQYTVLYSDSRGISRVYQMSYQDSVWKMWRHNTKFSQRFEGKVSTDARTIQAKWEKSFDNGKTWEHDFDLLYTKS